MDGEDLVGGASLARDEQPRARLRHGLRHGAHAKPPVMRERPPFRADHVGSLLRPPELLAAREDHAAGRIDDDQLQRHRGRGDPRRGGDAAGRRAAVGHRRRVPPHLLAHGLHLPARRGRAGRGGEPARALPRRGGRVRLRPARDARGRAGHAAADDLRRRLRVPARHRRRRDAQADHPLAEHGPLPGRQLVDRQRGLSRPGRLLDRPDRRLQRGVAQALRPRLPVPAARRHEPGLHQRPGPARAHPRDRRRPRAPPRAVHRQHQPGARAAGPTTWR